MDPGIGEQISYLALPSLLHDVVLQRAHQALFADLLLRLSQTLLRFLITASTI